MGLLLVLHPTQFCNLNCSYCWAPERGNTSRMSLDILHSVLKQVATRDVAPAEVCWLTGEPLVLGLDYFKQAIGLIREALPRETVRRLLIQTNATLIDEPTAAYFAANDVTVGVSVDGPEHIHDLQRADRKGGATHSKVMRGIDLLTRYKVKGGAICVITRNTLRLDPEDLFRFFSERGIAWSYLIEAQIGENADNRNALTLDDLPAIAAFLGKLMDLWGEHPNAYIKDFDQLARRLYGYEAEYSLDNLGCLDILNVLPNGDFFWGNPELMSATTNKLSSIRSNIARENVWSFKETENYRRLQAETHRGTLRCQEECGFFASCRGGNPAHKFYTEGKFDVAAHLTCRLNDQVIAPLMAGKFRPSNLHLPQ